MLFRNLFPLNSESSLLLGCKAGLICSEFPSINMYSIMICIWCSCCWSCRRNKVDINYMLQWVGPTILLHDAPIQSILSTAGSNLATLGIVVAQGLPAIWTSWQGGMDDKQNHGRVFCAGWVMSVGIVMILVDSHGQPTMMYGMYGRWSIYPACWCLHWFAC